MQLSGKTVYKYKVVFAAHRIAPTCTMLASNGWDPRYESMKVGFLYIFHYNFIYLLRRLVHNVSR